MAKLDIETVHLEGEVEEDDEGVVTFRSTTPVTGPERTILEASLGNEYTVGRRKAHFAQVQFGPADAITLVFSRDRETLIAEE